MRVLGVDFDGAVRVGERTRAATGPAWSESPTSARRDLAAPLAGRRRASSALRGVLAPLAAGGAVTGAPPSGPSGSPGDGPARASSSAER